MTATAERTAMRLSGRGAWQPSWIAFADIGGMAKEAAKRMPVDELEKLIYELKEAIDAAKVRLKNAKY